MDNDTFKNYVEDCLDILIERAEEANQKAKEKNSTDFDKGRSFGYYETLNFLINQAELFHIKSVLKKKVREYEPYY